MTEPRRPRKAFTGPEDRALDILIVSQFYWPEPIGNAMYVTDAAQWFARRDNNRINVLTGRPYYPDMKIASGYETGENDRQTIENVDILRLPTLVPTGGGARERIKSEVNFLFRAVWRLLAGKARRRRHVISFCPSILAIMAGVVACKRGGRHLAVVYDIQSGLASGLGMVKSGWIVRAMRLTERVALNRASHIVVLSHRMKAALEEIGVRRPIHVVPIWVDETQIRPLPRLDRQNPLLIYSGNLGRKQGLDQVLDLAEVLKQRRPDVRFLIRGNGSQADDLETIAESRGLDNMAFEPLVPMEKLNEGLAGADIHLVPQNPDAADFAVPSKVYNIMAAARPFVCTAVKGSSLWALSEESKAFLCVTPNDPEIFADAVIGLLDDNERAKSLGDNGRRYVEANVARDAVLARYASFLD